MIGRAYSQGPQDLPSVPPQRRMVMSMEQAACWAMSAVCAGGGIYAYVQKTSLPSLIAGLSFGALYGISGQLMRGERPINGVDMSLVTSALLLIAMGPRAYQTRGNVPMVLSGLGTLVLLRMGYVSYNLRHGGSA